MRKLLPLLAILAATSATSCATWYTSDEELAEMKARRNTPVLRECERLDEFGDLFCKDIPPEPECIQLAPYIYDCTELAVTDKALGF
jgi:hypothetical protein